MHATDACERIHLALCASSARRLAPSPGLLSRRSQAAAEAGDDGAEQPKKKMKKQPKKKMQRAIKKSLATAASVRTPPFARNEAFSPPRSPKSNALHPRYPRPQDSSDGDEESDDESDDGPKASKQRANAASVRAPHLASRVSYISKIEKTRRKCRRRSSSKRMRRVSRSKVRPSDGPKWQHDSRGRYFLTGIRKEKRMRAVQKPMRAMKQKPMRPPRSSVVKAN